MNDPHVDTLYYTVRHPDDVDFDNAPSLVHEEFRFNVRIEGCRAEIEMKDHVETVDAARAIADPFLRTWELSAALRHWPPEIEFVFERAKIVDRNPTPGPVYASGRASISFKASAKAHVRRGKYPDPPIGITRDGTVDLMFDRYCRYRNNQMTLAEAANFCLTALELTAGKRKAASQRYMIAEKVLGKLGELAAKKGGKDARKAVGAQFDFTPAERRWLRKVMEIVIRRAAEIAHDPNVSREQITMAHLPPL